MEGRLIARGQEPKNVQVVVHEANGGVDPEIKLHDVDGIFEIIKPEAVLETEAEIATKNGEHTAVTEESNSENDDI